MDTSGRVIGEALPGLTPDRGGSRWTAVAFVHLKMSSEALIELVQEERPPRGRGELVSAQSRLATMLITMAMITAPNR
jgi:hypothetical protein